MIDPKELKLDNLILHKGEIVPVYQIERRYKTVYRINDIDVDERVIGDTYQPVPLTPEILEACGFEHVGEPFRRWISDDIGIDITPEDDPKYIVRFIMRYRKSGNTQYPDRNGPFIEMIFCPMLFKYLHQVMNLWHSITGTELTVNLNKVKV